MKYKNLVISSIILIVPAFYFGLSGDHIAMGIIIIPSALIVLLWLIGSERLASVKIGALDVKLHDAIHEAYATIEQLKTLQASSCKIELKNMYTNCYFAVSDTQKNLIIIDDLYNSSKDFGNLDSLNDTFKKGYIRLIGQAFIEFYYEIDNEEVREKFIKIFEGRYGQLITDEGSHIPSYVSIEEYLNLNKIVITDDMKFKLEIYKSVLKAYENKYDKLALNNILS